MTGKKRQYLAVADIGKILAQNIRRLREERGWSKEALAQNAGVSLQGVKYAEGGKRWPRKRTIVLLAKTLGVPEETLFYSTNGPQKNHNGRPVTRDTVQRVVEAVIDIVANEVPVFIAERLAARFNLKARASRKKKKIRFSDKP